MRVEEAGFPGGTSGEEPARQCRRCKRIVFDPWVGKIPWRRAWQPTPVYLPGESPGQRSLGGYSLLGHTESHATEGAACTRVEEAQVNLEGSRALESNTVT